MMLFMVVRVRMGVGLGMVVGVRHGESVTRGGGAGMGDFGGDASYGGNFASIWLLCGRVGDTRREQG
jgi:hypothetical protein